MDLSVEKLGWLSEDGPSAALVPSSRIRVARSFKNYPFPYKADEVKRREILTLIEKASREEDSLEALEFIEMEKLSPLDKQLLLEDHLVSPYFIQESRGRGLLLDAGSAVSIMINEEDHLRLQCFVSGLNLEKGWTQLNRMDDAFENRLPYAFHEAWGYLTACPTNLGTGLRASTLLHLPGLVLLQALPHLIQSLNHTGIVVRGFYGEGTEAQGHFFQMANAFSLGPTEEDIVARVTAITGQVIAQELAARERLKKEHGKMIEDRLWRSFSLLKSARIISSPEAMEHLSMTRMGAQMEILPPVPVRVLNELMLLIQPANLQKKFGVESEPLKRDVARAEFLRTRLESFG